MIEFSVIDKEFSIYRNNAVLLYGAAERGLWVKGILSAYGIQAISFIDNDTNKKGKIIDGIPVFPLSEAVEYLNAHEKCVIQIASRYEAEMAESLNEQGIKHYILYTEFRIRVHTLQLYEQCQKYPFQKAYFDEKMRLDILHTVSNNIGEYLLNDFQNTKEIRLMFSPPKVGSSSIRASVRNAGGHIIKLSHTYKYIEELSAQDLFYKYPVKLIVGVRDPIQQNLSLLYQVTEWYWDSDEWWTCGGDAEQIFEKYIIQENLDSRNWFIEYKRRMKTDYLAQHFFEQQIEPFFGVDVYQYSFDKELGYSVYHINEKLDIMIYQMEKMNLLTSEIGNFLGIDHFELVRSNEGSKKWYRDSYVKAEKYMQFSEKYFIECYSSKYVNHFYNTQDIEMFKSKWDCHVRSIK